MPKRETRVTVEQSRARYEMLTRSEHESWQTRRAHLRKMQSDAERFLAHRDPWDEVKKL